MGDVQSYFIDQKVRNFYSVSISGYHIAEAGALIPLHSGIYFIEWVYLCEYYRAGECILMIRANLLSSLVMAWI